MEEMQIVYRDYTHNYILRFSNYIGVNIYIRFISNNKKLVCEYRYY